VAISDLSLSCSIISGRLQPPNRFRTAFRAHSRLCGLDRDDDRKNDADVRITYSPITRSIPNRKKCELEHHPNEECRLAHTWESVARSWDYETSHVAELPN